MDNSSAPIKLEDTTSTKEKSTSNLCDEKEEELTDMKCGYTTSCKPDWLQKYANPKAFLVLITICVIFQGFAISGINNVSTAVYERRYLLSSKESGFVSSIFDVSAGLTVLFVGYFGGTSHQPRILAISLLVMSLGTLIMSLAHFTAPAYNPSGGTNLECSIKDNLTSTCSEDGGQGYLRNYIYFLLFGQILNGFTGTCIYTLGVTYLDEISPANNAALYIGIMSGGAVLGPAIGYLLGGSLLNIYVDFPSSPPTGLTSDDPGWVGAWWLGFIVSSIGCFVLALFMFLFPKELPGTAAIRAAKISQAHDNGTEAKVNQIGFGLTWRDLPKAILYLLKNSCFMCITVSTILEFVLTVGLATFLPKFVSNQFSQTLSTAAILTGTIGIPAAAAGQIIGGMIIKRFDLGIQRMLKFLLCSSGLALLLSPVLLARCSDTKLAGVLAAYPGNTWSATSEVNLSSACNAGCGCTTALYDPVCADGIQYFSPCFAGCPQGSVLNADGVKEYHNCSCPLGKANLSLPSNQTSVAVTRGMCDADCNILYYLFLPVAFLLYFFHFTAGTPLTISILRVVPDKSRSYAIGLRWVFLRFLGSIPGPILFGAMIDSSCTLWQDDCDGDGSCWVYDNFELSVRIFGLVAAFKVTSLIFIALALKLYKPPKEAEAKTHALDESKNVSDE